MMPNLLSRPNPLKEGELLFGVEAFLAMFEGLDHVAKIDDLEQYVIYSWLGSAAQRSKIHEKKMALLQAMEKKPVVAPVEDGEVAGGAGGAAAGKVDGKKKPGKKSGA